MKQIRKSYRYHPFPESGVYLMNYKPSISDFTLIKLNCQYSTYNGWINLAQSVLKYTDPNGLFPIWYPHIEQFSLVMLHLEFISRHHIDYLGKPVPIWEHLLLDEEDCDDLHETDIEWYAEAWFRLIGHPKFLVPILLLDSYANFSWRQMHVAIAADDLNKKIKNEA